METIIGIDLGTTNSEVAILQQGRPFIIRDSSERKIIPSFVGKTEQGELIVGEMARNQYIIAPERTIKSIKRKMGTEEKVTIGEESYTPQEISAFILKHLKTMAEKYLNKPVEHAVITVPAYFTDKQRQATKDAGEIAGLKVERILNEPTAAALTYGLDRQENQNIIVYDLGGGTFDLSIIEINSGVIEVRATKGNSRLGGDDFDELLVNHIAKKFQEEHGIDLKENRVSLARLTRAAEQAKIRLSNEPFALIKEEFIATKDSIPLHLEMEIERTEFESLIEELLKSTMECVKDGLKESGLTNKDINKILLVGGSTRIPLIAKMLEDEIGIVPNMEIDPDLCVAMGASVQAGIIAGESIETILVDVAPHSLGIEVANFDFGMPILDQYSILIRRNTTIPVSKSEVYTTLFPDQKKVGIRVFQGEEPTASKNTFLGEFFLENLAVTKKGMPEIVVNFDYDVNGIVHISALDKKTGNKKEITVTSTPETLTSIQKERASERVAGTQVYSEAELEDVKEGAESLLLRARQVYESLHSEATQKTLLEQIENLEKALKEGNQEEIEENEDSLLELLYDLE
ncbi:MAG: Hsp70 family protein [Candidatus Brocadiae bacterium]|nr:Hsp70 family protein [Candidatus Brocadiia bacterium]